MTTLRHCLLIFQVKSDKLLKGISVTPQGVVKINRHYLSECLQVNVNTLECYSAKKSKRSLRSCDDIIQRLLFLIADALHEGSPVDIGVGYLVEATKRPPPTFKGHVSATLSDGRTYRFNKRHASAFSTSKRDLLGDLLSSIEDRNNDVAHLAVNIFYAAIEQVMLGECELHLRGFGTFTPNERKGKKSKVCKALLFKPSKKLVN